MKRWIALMAAAGLLVQGTASASMAPRPAPPATAAAADTATMPCHGEPDETAPATPATPADCCDGDCACSALCAGHATAATLASALPRVAEPQRQRAAMTSALHAAYALTPLRPPIASQSSLS